MRSKVKRSEQPVITESTDPAGPAVAASPTVPAGPRVEASEVSRLAQELEGAQAEQVLRWALDRWGSKISLCTSFQASGMVVLDLALKVRRDLRIFTIDTGRLPQESYSFMEEVRERYGIEVDVFVPDADRVQELVHRRGPNLFYRSIEGRLECCQVRKVEPLRRALDGLEAWITGLRREQTSHRAGIGKVELDLKHGGIVKVNPLADWSEADVWDYVKSQRVPTHPLYAQGYTSIGCAPCTRATRPGEETRAGRWWWENGSHKECGLHIVPPAIAMVV